MIDLFEKLRTNYLTLELILPGVIRKKNTVSVFKMSLPIPSVKFRVF